MNTKNVKVAFVTDDGSTISPHFGRALYYEVLTIADGLVSNRERREKAGHHTFAGQEEHREHGPGHGLDEHSRAKHHSMTENVKDCQILVARGMGFGAYQHITDVNIRPIITNTRMIDEAVQEIINGTIVNHEERLH